MNDKLATIIRAELSLHGMNQAQLGRELGLSQSMTSKLLRGERTVTPALIARIFVAIHKPYFDAAPDAVRRAYPAALDDARAA